MILPEFLAQRNLKNILKSPNIDLKITGTHVQFAA